MAEKKSLQDRYIESCVNHGVEVTVFLMNGFQMKGVIKESDRYTLRLYVKGKDNLIYKHAVSTIVPSNDFNMR